MVSSMFTHLPAKTFTSSIEMFVYLMATSDTILCNSVNVPVTWRFQLSDEVQTSIPSMGLEIFHLKSLLSIDINFKFCGLVIIKRH
jgi:hypothetical protein